MTARKPSSHGIVVENKESGLRYASHDSNFDSKTERYVRDLRAGESVLAYPVKDKASYEASEAAHEEAEATLAAELAAKSESGGSEPLADGSTKTEGAAPAGSPEKKEGN